ncbi:MAG: carboxymuconolactone decarboxylase family protein [Pseudomonadota bacterium]
MARIAPLRIEDVDAPDIKDRFEHYRNTRGFTPHSIMTMVRRPNLVRAFMALKQAVLYEGTVSEELKMLVSLIASQASGCTYCQAHMANLSSIYSASDSKIQAVWSFQTSELFSDAERAALTLAYHSALVPNEATDADFERLRQHFDDGQIVEIVATISLFGYLNRWNDTVATELEEHAIDVAERSLTAVGWALGKHAAST